MEKQNYHPYLKTILVILTLVLVIIISSLLLMKLKSNTSQTNTAPNQNNINQTTKKEENISPLPEQKGVISLETENNQEIFNQDDLINLYVYASSDNQPIVGYDLVLKYDPMITEFQEHKNLLPDFQVFIKKEDDKLLITGLKSINSNSKSIFSENQIINLTFKAKSKGKARFSFEFKPNEKNESNLINEKSEDILGKTKNLEIKVK